MSMKQWYPKKGAKDIGPKTQFAPISDEISGTKPEIGANPINKCKHYGMSHYGWSSGGNQCPLVKNAYAPCQMEMEGQGPDWDKCPRHPKQIRDEI